MCPCRLSAVLPFDETLDRSVKDLKEVLPSVQALIQDTEERVMASRFSGDFSDLQKRVGSIEYIVDMLANHDLSTADDRRFFDRMHIIIHNDLENVSVVLKQISASLEIIRYRQQLESCLGVTSDGVKIVGRVDDVLKIVGRVDDVFKIVEILKGSSTNHQLLHVFPIVGMAELTVLREMLRDLGVPMAGGADSIGETLEHLSKELQGKRFLLVLDDVWNEDVDKWDGLKKCLLEVGGSNGSVVLVTTRSEQATSIIETFPGSRHDLKPLSDAECWSIFRKKVSGEPLPRDWEDFTVEKEQLIQLWMAEGFLVQSNDQRMEDTGDVFFNKFVDSSFVEVVEWDERGKIRSCKMNRLMHDLALHVSKFRTLNLDFHHMRTLNLDGADIKELIDSIGDLECLRFLDLSRTCIKALPESITHLHNMQTLRLIECASLESLPRDMRGLLSLRHIYFTYHHQMPVKVGCLTSLQTLPFFIVGKDSDSTIEELESLNGLRGQLSIYNLQEVKNKTEAEKANLRGKTKIYKLEFVWRSGRKCFKNDEEVLEALQPPSNLETLKIEHYGGEKLPSWLLMKSPTHGGSSLVNCLVNLKLIDCKRCDLPMLGHLPRLESLEIDGLDKVRTGFSETMAVFPALKKLSLCRMVNLVEWMVPVVSEGHSAVFPFLEELSIMSCPLLASISLKNAPSLAQLEICFCDELKSLSMDCSASTALEDLTIKCVQTWSPFLLLSASDLLKDSIMKVVKSSSLLQFHVCRSSILLNI
uniref:Uncharacterized protein n=1 Tax=Salix viminalis TaxID=40686 RepID=A0A6N2KQK2_SALVM